MSGQIIPLGLQQATQNQVDVYIAQRATIIFEKIMNHVNPVESVEIMDIQETCSFLKCTEPTLNAYVKNDGLKKHKKGQKVYYLRRECIDFVASLPGDDE